MSEVTELIDIINDFFGCDAAYFDVNPYDFAKHLLSRGVKVNSATKPLTGKWVKECKNRYKCSNCNTGRNTDTQLGWNFCPTCGTKMVGEPNV